MKKWSFQKMHNEKVHFQKVEYLVKAVKKCFLKKIKCLASTYSLVQLFVKVHNEKVEFSKNA